MLIYPHGQHNPHHYRYCCGCGAPLGTTTWSTPPGQPQGQWHPGSPPLLAPTGPPAAPDPWAAPAARRGSSSWPRGVQIGAVASVVAVVFVAIVVIAITKSGGSGSSSNETTPSAAPPSSSDDWERAVCRPGTFLN